jgi:hypothetical protein
MKKYGKFAIIILFSLIWLPRHEDPGRNGTVAEVGPTILGATGVMWQQERSAGGFHLPWSCFSDAGASPTVHRGLSAHDSLPLILLSFH